MSEHLSLVHSGMGCDATGCEASITGPTLSLFEGYRHYERLARVLGWTIWAGRSRRTYCPEHTPAAGHKMHQVAARGCCDGCSGTGASGDSAVPGGLCWDCRGTGHPHEGRCAPGPPAYGVPSTVPVIR